jgi:uncharacterized membrane protein YphA (DoxX/SURF4 family)
MTDAPAIDDIAKDESANRSHVGDVLLRIVVGGMLIPHGIGKFLAYGPEVEVFGKVFGLNPAPVWVIGAAIFQIVIGGLIVAGKYVRPASLLLTAFMVGTIVVANHDAWFWQFKGAEYSVFWALMGIVLALKSDPGSC